MATHMRDIKDMATMQNTEHEGINIFTFFYLHTYAIFSSILYLKFLSSQISFLLPSIFNIPDVAGAVLQSPLLLIN